MAHCSAPLRLGAQFSEQLHILSLDGLDFYLQPRTPVVGGRSRRPTMGSSGNRTATSSSSSCNDSLADVSPSI
jgi:hypothetical protein